MLYEEQTETREGVCQAGHVRKRIAKRGNNQKSEKREEELGNVRREVREEKGTSGRCEVRGRKENAGKKKRRGGQ